MDGMEWRAGTTATLAGREAELVASFNRALLADADLAQRTHRELVAAHRQHDLMVGGRQLCNVLRPRLFGARRCAQLRRVSRILAALFERIGQHLLSSDRLLDLISATEAERAIWAVDPGYPGISANSRLDSFMVGDLPRFVEYNAESPASIGFNDVLSDVFLGLPAVQRWEHKDRLERFHAQRHLWELLLWAYREWGGTNLPSIAVVDMTPEAILTRRDFEICAQHFRDQGAVAIITDPRRFEYRNGKLMLGDQHITLIYRRCLLHELLDEADRVQPLLQAYRDGAVCVINSPRSKIVHKKAVMALLSSGTLGLPLTPEEQQTVDATVPWTRRLVSGDTTYEGRRVDLETFVLDHQPTLVLKPSDDYGGKGVVLGWETSADDWKRAVAAALGQDYVVQERVLQPSAEFPVWGEGRAEIVPLLLDTDPILYRGEMGGLLTRISGSALLNVSAGTGSTPPSFVVKEED